MPTKERAAKENAAKKVERDMQKKKRANGQLKKQHINPKIGHAKGFSNGAHRRTFIQLLDKYEGDIDAACAEYPCKPYTLYKYLVDDVTDFRHEVLRRVQLNTALYHTQGQFYRYHIVLHELADLYDKAITGEISKTDWLHFHKMSKEHSQLVHEDIDNVFSGDVMFNFKALDGKIKFDSYMNPVKEQKDSKDETYQEMLNETFEPPETGGELPIIQELNKTADDPDPEEDAQNDEA